MKWTVVWTAAAERDFGKLDPETRRRVQLGINDYAQDAVGDVRRLQDITPRIQASCRKVAREVPS